MMPTAATSRSALHWYSVLFAALLTACGGTAEPPSDAEPGSGPGTGPTPRNLLLVSLDTLRPDHLGIYGYERDTSPALDRFTRGFTVFDRAHTVAPWTAPSLITLMTSLHPDAHEVKRSPDPGLLSEDARTLAETLRAAGFRTGAFTEGGYAKADFGLGQGFDVYPDNPGDAHGFTSNRRYPSRLAGNLDRCIEWLDEQGEQGEQPFFCFFQTYEPHSPYQAPLDYVHRFQPDYDEEAEHARLAEAVGIWNERAEISDDDLRLFQRHLLHCDLRGLPKLEDSTVLKEQSRRQGRSLYHGEVSSGPGMVEWYTDLYDAEICYADAELARLWTFLEESGRAEDTLVVIVSDHGEALGEHGDIGHGRSLFRELTRIVFAVGVPGREQAPRSAAPVGLIDVMPGVLELLGLPHTDPAFQGESFVPWLDGSAPDGERPMFAHATLKKEHPQHSVTVGEWTLIVDDLSGDAELYDLRQDPGAERNVAAEHPERVERMRALMEAREAADRAVAEALNSGAAETELSEEAREELRALGYMGD